MFCNVLGAQFLEMQKLGHLAPTEVTNPAPIHSGIFRSHLEGSMATHVTPSPRAQPGSYTLSNIYELNIQTILSHNRVFAKEASEPELRDLTRLLSLEPLAPRVRATHQKWTIESQEFWIHASFLQSRTKTPTEGRSFSLSTFASLHILIWEKP